MIASYIDRGLIGVYLVLSGITRATRLRVQWSVRDSALSKPPRILPDSLTTIPRVFHARPSRVFHDSSTGLSRASVTTFPRHPARLLHESAAGAGHGDPRENQTDHP
jgi:hypothetical protein